MTEDGRAVTDIVSDNLIAVACQEPGNVSVQGHRILSYCGNALHEQALFKSPISSDLHLRYTAPGKEGIIMLDNDTISPALLSRFLPALS